MGELFKITQLTFTFSSLFFVFWLKGKFGDLNFKNMVITFSKVNSLEKTNLITNNKKELGEIYYINFLNKMNTVQILYFSLILVWLTNECMLSFLAP